MTALLTAQPRAPRVVPSGLSSTLARESALPCSFEYFGELSAEVLIAREATLGRLAHWLANNRTEQPDPWRAAQLADPRSFKRYTIIRMAQPSFFLPAGEVVFEVQKNPTQIAQSPPARAMLRHLAAMDAFPSATFYYLEPVFTRQPALRLYTADELREEAAGDRRDAEVLACRYGALFRMHHWLCRQRDRVEQTLNRWADQFDEMMVARRQPQMAPSPHWSFDPILCFELPEEPGRLWFEAHWYEGVDGRTYVHY
ncbi:MAG: hypothetical protein KDA37_02565 [Planctomycetales bacterium]|nr:hypothetical protein [Planctomycetales bacterium]